jgi:hypothetical protein
MAHVTDTPAYVELQELGQVEIDNHGSFPNTRILTPDDGHRG